MLHLLWGDMTIGAFAAMALAVFLASLLQSVTGMGFGLVAAPVLALIDPRFVPVTIIVLGLLVSVLGAWRDRHAMARREIAVAMAGRATGAVVAGWALAVITDRQLVSYLFAGTVLLAAVLTGVRWRLSPRPFTLVVAGLASGLMGTFTSIGAPPMGLVYQREPGPKVRATLNGFFTLGAGVSLAALAAYGHVRLAHLGLALGLLPPLLAGTWLSPQVARYADRRFRVLILAVCVASSLMIIWRAIAST